MAVKKIEAAARRLAKKLAELALGPTSSTPAEVPVQSQASRATEGVAPRARGSAATHAATAETAHREVDDVSEDLMAEPAPETVTAESSPIRTRTLARLLAAQGHTARALAIYEELVAASAGDLGLVQEAEAVRSPQAPRPVAGPTIDVVRAPAALYGRDQITAAVVDPGTLFVHWEVTDAGAARARAVAESAGRSAGEPAPVAEPPLTLRIIVLRADAGGVVRSEAIEHAPAPTGGETFVTGLPADATLFAAVGIRRGDRFVAITHAPAAYTPPVAPAELPALTFAPPPPAPESPLDASPPVEPTPVALAPMVAAVVLQKAAALREPTPWPHSSDLEFRATSSR